METSLTVPEGLAHSRTWTEGKDAAGVLARAMLSDSRDLAGTAGTKAQTRAQDLAAKGKARYAKQAKERAKHLERRAEKMARKLPVDTPLDERRRKRTTRRGLSGFLLLVTVVGVAAAIYVLWQRRQPTEAEQAPDAFGAAVDKSGDGRVTQEANVR